MTSPSEVSAETVDVVTPDHGLINQVVDHYADGLRNGSVETLQKAFHPQAIMAGYMGEDRLLVTMEGFHELVRTVPAPATTGEPFRHEVTSIHVTGNTATAEIAEYSFLGHDFRTCFQLLKTGEQWQITAKLFTTV